MVCSAWLPPASTTQALHLLRRMVSQTLALLQEVLHRAGGGGETSTQDKSY